jgi:preprotein translocase subunit SecD
MANGNKLSRRKAAFRAWTTFERIRILPRVATTNRLFPAFTVLLLACVVIAADKAPAKVEFRLAAKEPANGLTGATIAGTAEKIYLHEEPVLSGKDIAEVRLADDRGKPAIAIKFTKEGREKMFKVSRENEGKPLAFVVDDEVVSVPVLRSKIGENAIVTGQFTREEAARIVKGIGGK